MLIIINFYFYNYSITWAVAPYPRLKGGGTLIQILIYIPN